MDETLSTQMLHGCMVTESAICQQERHVGYREYSVGITNQIDWGGSGVCKEKSMC